MCPKIDGTNPKNKNQKKLSESKPKIDSLVKITTKKIVIEEIKNNVLPYTTVLVFFLIFFAWNHVRAIKNELAIAKKFPTEAFPTEEGFNCRIRVPNKERHKPVITFSFNFSPLSHSNMLVKSGARHPKRVAEAILVSLTATKKVAKWLPNNIPAKIIGILFSGDSFPDGFTTL